MSYEVQGEETWLSTQIFGFLDSPLVHSALGLILIYLQAVYINRMFIKYRMASVYTLVPGMVFCLFSSFLTNFQLLSPYYFANFFVILSIGQLLGVYKQPRVADSIFNIGFFIGTASLFVINYIYFLPIVMVGVYILRSGKFDEQLQLLCGVALVYVLYLGSLFIIDVDAQSTFVESELLISFAKLKMDLKSLLQLGVLVFMSVYSVLTYSTFMSKKAIQSQKRIDILFWVLLQCGLVFFFGKLDNSPLAILAFVPLSFFFSSHLLRMKNLMMQELIHVGVVVALFFTQFGPDLHLF